MATVSEHDEMLMAHPVPPADLPAGPAWEVARLFPNQGEWTEEDYLALNTNRLVELSDGRIEFPPMPTPTHQLILQYLFLTLREFVLARKLGVVLLAATPVRLWSGKMREPDVFFVREEHRGRIQKQFTEGPSLVIEIVSASDPKRDLILKRSEYAQANIPEYWIVDPAAGTILVLHQAEPGAPYVEHGTFGAGQAATSPTLPGFAVDVTEALAARD